MSMDISSYGYMNHFPKNDNQVDQEADIDQDLENDGDGSIERAAERK